MSVEAASIIALHRYEANTFKTRHTERVRSSYCHMRNVSIRVCATISLFSGRTHPGPPLYTLSAGAGVLRIAAYCLQVSDGKLSPPKTRRGGTPATTSQ